MNKHLPLVEARYAALDFSRASPIPDHEPRFVVSAPHIHNYCRWWLDQVAKYFVFEVGRGFHSIPISDRWYISGRLDTPFQNQTLSALDLLNQTEFPTPLLLRGDLYITSGLTYFGGQNISRLVAPFRRFILDRFDAMRPTPPEKGYPPRVYVSRAKCKFRRLLNEDELDPVLEQNGFVKVAPEDLSVAEQISLFRAAEVIVSPHGAGLTNVIFCRAGARVLEIFPDIGLHSSAFMRLATLCGLEYGFLCGSGVGNSKSSKNPGNADIVCPPRKLEAALSTMLEAPSLARPRF